MTAQSIINLGRPAVSRPSTPWRAAAWSILAVGVAYLAFLEYRVLISRVPKPDSDFSIYYVWSWLSRNGMNPYSPVDIREGTERFGIYPQVCVYPPPFVLLLEPFSLLGPGRALWVWHIINLALLLATLLLLLAELRANRELSLTLAALTLLYGPLSVALFWGQVEIVLLFLLYLGLRWSRVRKDWRCGVILAFAGVLKVNPFIVLGQFVVLRRWRVCASAILAVIAAGCLSAWRFGPAINVQFVRRALEDRVYLFAPNSISIITMMYKASARLLGGTGSDRALPLAAASLVGLVVAAMTVAGTLRAHRDGRDELAYGLWVAGAVLLTPINWAHELVLLLIPMALMVAGCSSRVAAGLGLASYFFAEVGLVGFCGFWLYAAEFQYHGIKHPTWDSVQRRYPLAFFASMLLLFFSVWYESMNLAKSESNNPVGAVSSSATRRCNVRGN